MSQPPTYDREFNFSDYQASSPSAPLPASHIDAELNRIKVTLDAILNNLGLIQRADGDLANASVGVDQLDTTISGGMSPPTKWLTATAYALNAVVWNAQKLYRCAIAHTSGTFSTDLAAAKWVELEDFTLSGVVNADSTTAGIVELATNAEAQAKSDATRAITPANLAALAASDTFAGLIELATDAEAVAAAVTNRALTPSNLAALTAANLTALKASDADAIAASSISKFVTPANLAALTAANLTALKASDAEARAKSSTSKLLTPANLAVVAPKGHLYGLTLSNNTSDATNDIDIAAGEAVDETGVYLMKLATGITKRLDASWAVGSGNGGLDTGSIADTTYHMWLIARSDTGVVDVLFSASASSPTMPANYDYKRRIGSIIRTSSAIVGFVQKDDVFVRKVPFYYTANNPGTSAVLVAVGVPTGIQVDASFMFQLQDATASSGTVALVSSPDATDSSPTISIYNIQTIGAGGANVYQTIHAVVRTDTSGRIRYRLSGSTSDHAIDISTMGWTDTRGRLG